MSKQKIIFSFVFAALLLAMQIASVAAAPALQEETPITGNIESILLEEDPESGNVIAVVITLLSENGDPVTMRLDIDTAIELGLVTDDGMDNILINEDAVGTSYPPTVLLEEEEKEHPVGSALSEFFYEMLGVDYETVMDYHDDGMGFGVIAQALWMTNVLEGDNTMFGDILAAKRSGNYEAITLPDGSIPQNWGQFRKAVMSDQEKAKKNLGAIMSGRAEKDSSELKLNPNGDKGPGEDKFNHKNSSNNKNKDKNNKNNKNKD